MPHLLSTSMAQTTEKVKDQTNLQTTGQPTSTGQEGITSHMDAGSVKEVSTIVTVPRKIGQAYDIQVPTELLTRQYVLQQINWTGTMTATTISFPGALLFQDTVSKVLSKYKWFKAGIRIQLKLQSTPYHQGSLLVTFFPCMAGERVMDNKYQNTGFQCMILSAVQEESGTMDCPYLHQADWMFTDYAETGFTQVDSRIGVIRIEALNPLLCSASCSTLAVPITVYASFIDIQLEGRTSGPAPKHFRWGEVKQQSSESSVKEDKGTDAKGPVDFIKPLIRRAPVVGPIFDGALDLLTSLVSDLNKPNSNQAVTITATKLTQNVAHCSGLTYADELSMYPNANLAQGKLWAGMETSHMGVSQMAQRPMLHDQHTFTADGQSVQYVVSPLALGANQAYPDFLMAIARAHTWWKGSIKYEIRIFMAAFMSFRCRLIVINGDSYANYTDEQSMDISVKGDAIIQVMVPYLRPTTWTNLDEDDAVYTSHPTILPRLIFTITSPIVGCSSGTPTVYFNIFRAGGEDTQFAGLRHAKKEESKSRAKLSLREFKHESLIDSFKKPFKPIVRGGMQSIELGSVMPEMSGTISDCIKRESTQLLGPLPFTFPGCAKTSVEDWSMYEPFHYFSHFYLWWRGSRVFTNYKAGYFVKMDDGLLDSWFFGDGVSLFAAATDTNTMRNSVKIPYYSTVPWSVMGQSDIPILDEYTYHISCYFMLADQSIPLAPRDISVQNSITDQANTIAAGDDMMYLYPVPLFGIPPSSIRKRKPVLTRHIRESENARKVNGGTKDPKKQ
jgi:hypothetical protein